MKNWVQLGLAGAALAVVANCGAPDRPDASDDETPAAAEAPVVPALPGVDERAEILTRFRDASPVNCPFFKESEGAEEGDFAGSPLLLCTGRFSQSENFGMALMLEDGTSNPAGTLFVTMGANRAPGAFAPLWELVHEMTGIDSPLEKDRFRSEISRWLFMVANLYSVDYEPMMTTSRGVDISAAANKMQRGTLTLKIAPPN